MARQPSIKLRTLQFLKQQLPRRLTLIQIREGLGLRTNEQTEFGRRLREWYEDGLIDKDGQGPATRYFFRSFPAAATVPKNKRVTKTQRARVIWRTQGRCEMCGRTVSEDAIKLHVDHKVPQAWGGESTDQNLWALCSICNEGKRDFFASITDPRVQQAMLDPRVHVRIGELLKAFDGEPVSSEYLGLVAHTHDDWQKRLRELRELGWEYDFTKEQDETGRFRTSFVLRHWEPWPEDPAAAIRAAERAKRSRR